MGRTYTVRVSEQAPLQLQLYVPNGLSSVLFVTSAMAEGENDIGSASIPVLALATTTSGIGTAITPRPLDPASPIDPFKFGTCISS